MNEQRYMVFADMADKHTVVWARDNVITLGMSANDANELFARYTSEKLSGNRIKAEWEIELEETGAVKIHSRLTEAQRIVEAIAINHLAIATSKDAAIADGRGSIYTASLTLFQTAIMAAYPHLSAGQIYRRWLACGESIEFCAAQIKAEEAELTHVHIQHDDTLREMIVPRQAFETSYEMCGWYVLGSMTAEDAHQLRYFKK